MVDFSNLPDLPEKGLQAALLWKVFGPPAGAIGQKLSSTVESFRLSNLGRIVEIASRKLGPRLDEPGSVPLRVFAETWESGTYSDDELMAEYFGGILAASRTPDGRNDRGASWAGLVGRLATDDVRMHYLLYQRWRALLVARHEGVHVPNLGDTATRTGVAMMYVPESELIAALGTDGKTALDIAFDGTQALHREGLIEDQPWAFGQPGDVIRRYAPDANETGVILCPSLPGLQLFYWAHGQGDVLDTNAIHRPDHTLDPVADLPTLGDGARLCVDMKKDPGPPDRQEAPDA